MSFLRVLLATTLVVTMLAVTGCRSEPGTAQMLNSSTGMERMRALARLSDEHRWSNIPTFIRYLEDDDVSVRWAAIQSLIEEAGTDFGYSPTGGRKQRSAAVARWKEWWRTEGARGPQGRPPSKAAGQPSQS